MKIHYLLLCGFLGTSVAQAKTFSFAGINVSLENETLIKAIEDISAVFQTKFPEKMGQLAESIESVAQSVSNPVHHHTLTPEFQASIQKIVKTGGFVTLGTICGYFGLRSLFAMHDRISQEGSQEHTAKLKHLIARYGAGTVALATGILMIYSSDVLANSL